MKIMEKTYSISSNDSKSCESCQTCTKSKYAGGKRGEKVLEKEVTSYCKQSLHLQDPENSLLNTLRVPTFISSTDSSSPQSSHKDTSVDTQNNSKFSINLDHSCSADKTSGAF
jgi:hypothetical protein